MNPRPLTMRNASAGISSGETTRGDACTATGPSGPRMSKPTVDPPALSGISDVKAALTSPGVPRRRSMMLDEEQVAPFRRVLRGRHRQPRRQHARGIVAAVDVQQADEAAPEQRRAHQQYAGNRHLTGHDCQPDPCGPRGARRTGTAAAVFGERLDEVEAADLKRRQNAEHQRRDQRRHQRKQHDARIEGQVRRARKIGRQQRRQAAVQQRREQQPCGAACQAEHQALDEQLPHRAATVGAERRANRHLAPARCRARELKAGDVRGRGEQQQPHRGEQDHQRAPDVGGHRGLHGRGGDANRSVAAEDGHRGHRRVRRMPAARRSLGGSLGWRRVRPARPQSR